MHSSFRKAAVIVAAAVGAGFGAAAIAGAADDNASRTAQARPQREALSSAAAAKVKQAALDKVPGATVLRTEAGGPYDTPYHAHIKTSDGKLQVVLVDASFKATAVQADEGRGRPGDGAGRERRGRGETALTGTTKQRVEAAVKAKYPEATIERTETNADAAAPYESHITTKAGDELEVLVSKTFEVVDARDHAGRP